MNNTKLIRALAERGMGWERSVSDGVTRWVKKEDGIPTEYHSILWDPLTNWNDCMMLVDTMEKKGFTFQYTSGIIGAKAIFAKLQPVNIYEEHSGVPRTAICMAAAKALGIEDV